MVRELRCASAARNEKSRRGGTPEGFPPRRLTDQRASRHRRAALYLVIRNLGVAAKSLHASNTFTAFQTKILDRIRISSSAEAVVGDDSSAAHIHSRPPNRDAKSKRRFPPGKFFKAGTAMANEQPHVQRYWEIVDGGKLIREPLVADR